MSSLLVDERACTLHGKHFYKHRVAGAAIQYDGCINAGFYSINACLDFGDHTAADRAVILQFGNVGRI